MPFPVFVAIAFALGSGTVAATARLSQRRSLAVAAAAAGAAVLLLFYGLAYLRFVDPLDDAMITLRYSRHLADGLGPNWNAEGRVEGYTSFLQMGLLAGLAKLGVDLVDATQALSIVALLATFYAVYRIWQLWSEEAEDSGLESPLVLAAVLTGLALTDGVVYWGFSGLETPLFMALVSATAYLAMRDRRHAGYPLSAVAAVAAAMARPEGLIVAAVTGAFVASDGLAAADRRRAVARVALWGATFALLYGAYFLWRYSYYDYLLPNTFYAKVGATSALYERGLEYVVRFGLQYQLLALFAGAALLLAQRGLRRDAAYVIVLCGCLLLGIVFEGGDAFGRGRFVVPLLPLLYLAGVAGFTTLLKRIQLQPAHAALVAVTALTLAGLSLLHSAYAPLERERDAQRERRLIGRWLNEHTPPDFTIAAFAVGAVSYYSDDRGVLDLLGLNDVVIAHTEVRDFGKSIAGHEKYNVEYVFGDVRPEIIVAGDADAGPLTVEDLQLQSTAAPILEAREIHLRDPRLAASYTTRWLVLDGRWFNILQRRDTLDQLRGPGLLNERNLLRDAASPAAWQTFQSTIGPGDEGLLVSSIQAGYGPYHRTFEEDLRPAPGQTFVALVWVRGTETSAGDQLSLSLRENGVHSPETETNGFFQLQEDWQPVWIVRTIESPDVSFLSFHIIKLSGRPKDDSFLFRDAQLLASD